jgi:hypothetical protein
VVARNHALTRLVLAYLVMIVAEFGEWLAVIVYAYVRGGASAAGLVVILQLIPSMLLAPLISAQLARIGLARLLAGAYAAATATLGCCGVAILVGAPVPVVYLAAVAFSLSLGVSRPVHHVLMPLVVRHPDEPRGLEPSPEPLRTPTRSCSAEGTGAVSSAPSPTSSSTCSCSGRRSSRCTRTACPPSPQR